MNSVLLFLWKVSLFSVFRVFFFLLNRFSRLPQKQNNVLSPKTIHDLVSVTIWQISFDRTFCSWFCFNKMIFLKESMQWEDSTNTFTNHLKPHVFPDLTEQSRSSMTFVWFEDSNHVCNYLPWHQVRPHSLEKKKKKTRYTGLLFLS